MALASSQHAHPFAEALADVEVAFSKASYAPGDIAVFTIEDGDLSAIHPCTAAWVGIAAQVSHSARWNLANGNPQPLAYAGTNPACLYDRATPSNTPIAWSPVMIVRLDGIETQVDKLTAETGEFKLHTDVDPGATLRVDFYHDIVDSYPASAMRAKVKSASDPQGEWIAIAEAVSAADDSASPASGVFRGQVLLSTDAAALTPGDGAVRATLGDTLTVEYWDSGGNTVIAFAQATVAVPGPSPTPIPSANAVALVALAALLLVTTIWRMRRVSSAQ